MAARSLMMKLASGMSQKERARLRKRLTGFNEVDHDSDVVVIGAGAADVEVGTENDPV